MTDRGSAAGHIRDHLDQFADVVQVGDLAGVFSLARPLSVDVKRAQEGFRGASFLVLAISLSLTVCGLVLAYRTRRGGRP